MLLTDIFLYKKYIVHASNFSNCLSTNKQHIASMHNTMFEKIQLIKVVGGPKLSKKVFSPFINVFEIFISIIPSHELKLYKMLATCSLLIFAWKNEQHAAKMKKALAFEIKCSNE